MFRLTHNAALCLLPPLPMPCHPQSANALTYDELQGLTYLQVKGSGIANTCPVLESGTANLSELKVGNYKLEKFCIEPTSFTVKEDSQFKGGDSEFVKTKLMTRLTYTLDAVSVPAKTGLQRKRVLFLRGSRFSTPALCTHQRCRAHRS